MTEIKDNIIERIKTGNLAMKPRWHYVLKTTAILSGIMLASIVAVYIATLIVFTLRHTGIWWTPNFGFMGISFFVTHSPWLLITVAGIFFVTLYVLVRHFGHSYRQPAIYSLIGLIIFLISATYALHYLSFQERVRDWSNRHEVPGLAPFYKKQLGPRPEDITVGKVIAVAENNILLETEYGEITVDLNPDTKKPKFMPLEAGLEIMIFGPKTSTSTVEAFGIRPLPPDMPRHKLPSREPDNN